MKDCIRKQLAVGRKKYRTPNTKRKKDWLNENHYATLAYKKSMDRLINLLERLETKILRQEFLNPSVSKASVGWHIEHSLLTINLIIENLQRSDPEKYKWKFNFIRTLIYTINKIPRGRAQSPTAVRPKTICNPESLQIHIDLTKEKINVLHTLNRNHYFEHPFFGKLNLKPTIKFLGLHTRHHLHIINDILKGNSTLLAE